MGVYLKTFFGITRRSEPHSPSKSFSSKLNPKEKNWENDSKKLGGGIFSLRLPPLYVGIYNSLRL